MPVVLQPQPQNINIAESAPFFAASFGVVMLCFVLGHVVGSIIRVIRSA